MTAGARISVTGVVQGVGFRPFVYNLALKHGLSGWCLNDSEGVKIAVEGTDVAPFIEELRDSPPPLSRITGLTVEYVPAEGFCGFAIRESRHTASKHAPVSADVATCPDCASELFTPSDRRHLYPFINCTNCGPRYSIVTGVPYDREKTTMARFAMCPDCVREYRDPANRRFHAQPNACGRCGPKVWLADRGGKDAGAGVNFDAIKRAQALLNDGAILAVKGLGGFHLACDARNKEAAGRLRRFKRAARGDMPGNKPFAVMAPDLKAVGRFASFSDAEERLLAGRVRPIVLLEKKEAGVEGALAGPVSPDNPRYGVMLPYAPLHHLLFHGAAFDALVMTSGNAAEEPIVTSNDEAVEKLARAADRLLLHDRDIYMRVDDSITRVDGTCARVFRRARGLAPESITLGKDEAFGAEVLACGAELKNTFCLGIGQSAVMSQHIGDMENAEALAFFEETVRNLKRTYDCSPALIALDMHPDYLSTRFAIDYAGRSGIADDMVVAVQHHHAHIVSSMAEHGLKGKVIGVAFDGAGLGVDGAVWGGEFLVCDRRSFTRAAHLEYAPQPGGDAGAREPWRMALSHIHGAFGKDWPEGVRAAGGLPERVGWKKIESAAKMIEGRINSPLTSSVGRLFDAAASITGLMDKITYEGEAAIRLEAAAGEAGGAAPYPFIIHDGEMPRIDAAPLIRAMVADASRGAAPSAMAAAFHHAVARMIADTAAMIRERTGINAVALSGGVFQNRLLAGLAKEGLEALGFEAYFNDRVPTNDAGVSLGQAVVAWETVKGRR